jgi:hypothetical protein
MSEDATTYTATPRRHRHVEPDMTLAPTSKVETALIYQRYVESKGKDHGGYPELFTRKYPAKSAGAKVLELQEWETLPDKCMHVLAEEVRRLRLELAAKGGPN